jgi:hypothetical protein
MRHFFSLGKVERQEVDARSNQVDYLLLRLKQGLLRIPVGMGIIQFLQGDGKPVDQAPPRLDEATRTSLKNAYFKVYDGTLAQSESSPCVPKDCKIGLKLEPPWLTRK